MKIRAARFWPLFLFALILVLPGACGRKTTPLTPDSPRPEIVQGLKAVARDTKVFLSWRVPTKNVEGKEMSPDWIHGFLLYRAEIARDRRKPRYRLLAELRMPEAVVPGSTPAPAVDVKSGIASWTDTALSYDRVYGYRIKAVSVRGGESYFSDEVRVAPLRSLSLPKNVAAAAGDSQVSLSWDPVTTRTDGSRYQGFVGYNIYRGTATGRYEETPLNREPVRTASYQDTAVANDTTYFYAVRSVDSPVVPWKESLDSAEVSATPRDQTPPARPEGLTVVSGVNRVFITWNENKERDLAGYHVYRSLKSGREYGRLTEKPANRTTYSDDTVTPGKAYYYVITAVDRSGNESPFSQEKKATPEKVR